jgi:hypothetical protein
VRFRAPLRWINARILLSRDLLGLGLIKIVSDMEVEEKILAFVDLLGF